MSPFVGQGMGRFISIDKKESLAVLKEFIEAGKVTPVIDRTYSLSEVTEAIRYMETGNVQGKVVIAM